MLIGSSTSVLCVVLAVAVAAAGGGSRFGRRAPSSELEVATLKASQAQQQVVAGGSKPAQHKSNCNATHRLRLFAKGVACCFKRS